uniref:Uncharacterized protein n=1 Tax=Cannabis sativa TaxID=3483 RepID=A0A803P384_CANSA
MSRVFKARYYPIDTFTSTTLGSNPSYVWRSILEAQKLVANGVRWNVGNGNSISVLGEAWLPDETNPRIMSNNPSLMNAKVTNLMKQGRLEWDEENLNDLFEPRDRALILQITLDPSITRDCLVWSRELSGVYTVKSAYRLM